MQPAERDRKEEPSAKPDGVAELARTFRARAPWDVAQKALENLGLPRGQGWAKTLAKLEGQSESLSERLDELQGAVTEHILCGEKLSRFYRFDVNELAKLRDAVAGAPIAESPFASAFPVTLSDREIEANYPAEMHLAAVISMDTGTACVFASTRAVLVREALDPAEFSEAVSNELLAYDEVVGVRLTKLQAMDVVWIPSEGDLIDVRIDFPKGMHQDVGGVAADRLRSAFNKLVGYEALGDPINLFPLIAKIYHASKEGSVVELAFGTTTASLKHEKMRKSGEDLRIEKYHVGGKAALTVPIEPYRMSVQWSVLLSEDVASVPELSFNGSSKLTGVEHPEMFDVSIRKCVGVLDYDYVRLRLASYM